VFGMWRPILAGILLIIWVPILAKIYSTITWSIYRKFGSNIKVARRIANHALFMTGLKLFVLVAVNAAIIWAIFIRSPPTVDTLPTGSLKDMAMAIAVALGVSLFGYLVERFQSLIGMIFFIVACITGMIFLPLGLMTSKYFLQNTGFETIQQAWAYPLWIAFCVIAIFFQFIASLIACYYIWNGPYLSWKLITVADATDANQAMDEPLSQPTLTTSQKLIGHWSGFIWESNWNRKSNNLSRWALETVQTTSNPETSETSSNTAKAL
jgi:hypothetical protein